MRVVLKRTLSPFIVALSLVSFARAQEQSGSSIPSSPPSASAAQSTKTNPQVVLRAETRLVQLNVIAQDKKGQPIEGLKREDFTLLDNGKTQNIALFASEPDSTPTKNETSDAVSPNAESTDAKSGPPPNVFGNRLR